MIPILENTIDFSIVFDAMPGHNALVLANPPLYTILAITDDFLLNSGKTKDQLIGKGISEIFFSNSADLKDTGEKSLLASFERVTRLKQPQQLAAQRCEVADENGNFTEKYWAVKNKPVINSSGEVIYIIHTAEDVTDSVKAKEKDDTIEGLEQAFSLFSQAPVALAILKGNDFVVQLANEKMLEIYGRGKNILNRPIAEIRPELKDQGYLDLLKNVMATGESYFGYESPFTIIKDGLKKIIYYNFVYQAYYEDGETSPTGVLVFANEITERVTVKKDLQESQERFRTMAEGTEILIAIVDETSNATYFNKAWTDLTGRSMEDLFKFGWSDLLHPDDRYDFGEIYLAAFKDRKPFTGEFRLLDKKGEYRWLLAKGPARFRQDLSFAGYISSAIDITERKLAEELLQESEQRVRSLVESAPFPIGVYTGENMKIILANQSIIDVWGKGERVIGKLYSEILPELQNQQIFNQLNNVYNTGIAFHAKNQRVDIMIDHRLESYYFNYSFTPLFNSSGKVYGVMNTAADVTDLNVAKQKVEESEAQLRNLVMNAPVGICIVKGTPLKVEVVNDSFLEVVGKTREAFNESPYWDVMQEASPFYSPILENVVKTGVMYRGNDHELILIKNGKKETICVNFVYDPVKEEDGTVNKVMIVVIEVTEQVTARRKIEEVVAERTKELAEVNNNLRRSNDELAQFAYIASHDLQEPLRKVTTFTQLLEQGLPSIDERSKTYLDKINNSTSRMTALIRDVLAYSQLSKDSEIFEWVSLQEVVDEITDDFELLIEQKKAVINTLDLPVIQAIPLQMSQLFSNLISNALKFSNVETNPIINISARLMAKKEVVTYGLDTNVVYFDIEFKDNGIGFSQEHAERIFHIFQRLHAKNEYSGTGIGLAMCKKIVRNHNGEIFATANPGHGATFNLILPERQVKPAVASSTND